MQTPSPPSICRMGKAHLFVLSFCLCLSKHSRYNNIPTAFPPPSLTYLQIPKQSYRDFFPFLFFPSLSFLFLSRHFISCYFSLLDEEEEEGGWDGIHLKFFLLVPSFLRTYVRHARASGGRGKREKGETNEPFPSSPSSSIQLV